MSIVKGRVFSIVSPFLPLVKACFYSMIALVVSREGLNSRYDKRGKFYTIGLSLVLYPQQSVAP